mmetsp:Transcript_5744/g.13055  ORF Transcript_5744/g.13055 Transcript_5744/m.13055 type:complete len:309 (+) Transcript_5744:334-1260(+)
MLRLLPPLLVREAPGLGGEVRRERGRRDRQIARPVRRGARNRLRQGRKRSQDLLDHPPPAPRRVHGRVLRRGIADAAAGIGREVGQRRGQGEGALHVSHRAERQPRRKYQRPPEDERGRAESQQGMVSQPRAGGRRGGDVRRPDRREEPRGVQRPAGHGRHRLRRLPRRARRRGPPVQLPRRVRGHAGLVRPAHVSPRRVPRVVPAGEPRHAGEGELRARRAGTGHAAHLLEPDRAALRLPGGDARDALQGDARGHARAEGGGRVGTRPGAQARRVCPRPAVLRPAAPAGRRVERAHGRVRRLHPPDG